MDTALRLGLSLLDESTEDVVHFTWQRQIQQVAHEPFGEDAEFICEALNRVGGNPVVFDRLNANQSFDGRLERQVLAVGCVS